MGRRAFSALPALSHVIERRRMLVSIFGSGDRPVAPLSLPDRKDLNRSKPDGTTTNRGRPIVVRWQEMANAR